MAKKTTTTKTTVEVVDTPQNKSLLSAIGKATKAVEVKLDENHTLVINYRYCDVTSAWIEKVMEGKTSLVECILDVVESWSLNGDTNKLTKESLEEVGVVVQRLILDAVFFDALPGMKALAEQSETENVSD